MKKFSFIPVILVGSAFAQYFGAWWAMPIVCAVAAYFFGLNKGIAYAAGFVTISGLWYGMSVFADTHFDTPMSSILGGVFGNISNSLVYTLTATVGGIVAGFASLVGAWARSIFQPSIDV